MGRLIFDVADVRRVVEHTLAAPEQSVIADWSKATERNGWTPAYVKPEEPNVVLVHDKGVYLMSNGQPRDLVDEESAFCAYAKRCDPTKDTDWWEAARELVGGDDFGEYFPWANEMKKMLDNGAIQIAINFGQKRCWVAAVYPKGKAPKRERADIQPTPDEVVRRLQRVMKTKVVGFDSARKTFVTYKISPSATALIERIQKRDTTVMILNNRPTLELYKAVERSRGSA